MAARYRINFVREAAARHRRRIELLRILTVASLLLAILLVLTYAVYLKRDHRITVIEGRIQLLLSRMEKTTAFTPAQISDLHAKSRELAATLTTVNRIVDGITPWPYVLHSLDECCRAGSIQLRHLSVKTKGHTPILEFQSSCTAENQVAGIEAFLAAVNAHPAFMDAEVIAIGNERGTALSFRGQVALTRPRPPVKATVTPTKREQG